MRFCILFKILFFNKQVSGWRTRHAQHPELYFTRSLFAFCLNLVLKLPSYSYMDLLFRAPLSLFLPASGITSGQLAPRYFTGPVLRQQRATKKILGGLYERPPVCSFAFSTGVEVKEDAPSSLVVFISWAKYISCGEKEGHGHLQGPGGSPPGPT